MISQLRGRLVEKSPTEVVIDCNGVGYMVSISLHTYSRLPEDEFISLFTHHLVREDAQQLYGFMDKLERELFRLLISVSGIGASTARTMLSSLTPDEITQAIATEDARTVQSVKGIGAKTAQRVIIDLKDKILKVADISEISISVNNTARDEALSALETLGYARKQSQKIIDRILKQDTGATVEKLIKEALKQL
jgi:Holliday junction DNA helicase RuvA